MTPESNTSTRDVDAACTAAALAAPLWAATGRPERAAALALIADGLEDRSNDIVEIADAETFLGRDRLQGELARTTFQLRMFAQLILDGSYLSSTVVAADPDAPVAPLPDLRRIVRPLGPVAVFAASNFPLAFSVAGTDTASALAAGCPVILKAHPGHPSTSQLTGRIVDAALAESGASPGTFAVVHGFAAGPALIENAAIKAASFTGSVAGGRALYDLAAARPIPFFGELGSLNSFTITPSAAEARGGQIAADLAASILLGGGQFCTKPGFVLVPRTPAGSVLKADLAAHIRAAPAARMLNETVLDNFRRGCDALRADPAIGVLAEGGRADGTATPTLYEVVDSTIPAVALEECFGPTAVVAQYFDGVDLLTSTESLPGALTATVHSEPNEQALLQRLVDSLAPRVGRLIFDQYPTGVSVSPAMHHGGPYPASTNAQHTSVGTAAIERFLRPISYQNAPQSILPAELRD